MAFAAKGLYGRSTGGENAAGTAGVFQACNKEVSEWKS